MPGPSQIQASSWIRGVCDPYYIYKSMEVRKWPGVARTQGSRMYILWLPYNILTLANFMQAAYKTVWPYCYSVSSLSRQNVPLGYVLREQRLVSLIYRTTVPRRVHWCAYYEILVKLIWIPMAMEEWLPICFCIEVEWCMNEELKSGLSQFST